MTLGHLCNAGDAGCSYGRIMFGRSRLRTNDTLGGACDMCSSTLAGYREDVTFWWAA
jgi:hypothetical protein